MRIHFTIPGRPIGWARVSPTARIVGSDDGPRAIASMHDTPENKTAKAEVARLYRIAAKGHRTQSGPVRLDLLAVFDTPESWPRATQRRAAEGKVHHVGKPDLDNIEKLVLDALNKLAWADDGQVSIVTKQKRYGSPARIEITISALPQEEDEKTPAQRRLEKRVASEGWDAVLAKPAKRRNQSKTQTPDRMSAADFRASRAKGRMPRKAR